MTPDELKVILDRFKEGDRRALENLQNNHPQGIEDSLRFQAWRISHIGAMVCVLAEYLIDKEVKK